jgi:hypothetical protein
MAYLLCLTTVKVSQFYGDRLALRHQGELPLENVEGFLYEGMFVEAHLVSIPAS